MKLTFSQRVGLQEVKSELLKNELSVEIRNSLWTAICDSILNQLNNEIEYDRYGNRKPFSALAGFYRRIWIDFFKLPVDNLTVIHGTIRTDGPYNQVRTWFFSAKWNEVYDFVEFCIDTLGEYLAPIFNEFLKREFSAYRFVGGSIVEINSKEEIIEIEKALNGSDKFKPVKTHLATALSLISSKTKPDYRNSIKESISAVESLSKILLGDENTTLGEALKKIEQKHSIPGSLKNAFSSLYGYTSDKGGIRHALLNGDIEVGLDEARFMLIACSAFTNYLISKTE